MKESGDHRVSADDHIHASSIHTPSPFNLPFLLKRFVARRDAKTGRLARQILKRRANVPSVKGGRSNSPPEIPSFAWQKERGKPPSPRSNNTVGE